MKALTIFAAIALLTGSAYAAGVRESRVVSCLAGEDAVWIAPSGAKVGLCPAKKAGGKMTYLRSFMVVSVVNPATDKAERLMVGFQ